MPLPRDCLCVHGVCIYSSCSTTSVPNTTGSGYGGRTKAVETLNCAPRHTRRRICLNNPGNGQISKKTLIMYCGAAATASCAELHTTLRTGRTLPSACNASTPSSSRKGTQTRLLQRPHCSRWTLQCSSKVLTIAHRDAGSCRTITRGHIGDTILYVLPVRCTSVQPALNSLERFPSASKKAHCRAGPMPTLIITGEEQRLEQDALFGPPQTSPKFYRDAPKHRLRVIHTRLFALLCSTIPPKLYCRPGGGEGSNTMPRPSVFAELQPPHWY